ncbi:hypothetical protein IJT17_00345, partial [bacterium]|nr:hypothetical protein [bacterium]
YRISFVMLFSIPRKWRKYIAICLIYITILSLTAETYLRYKGYEPEKSISQRISSIPGFHPDLGWTNLANEKVTAYETPADHQIFETVWANGARSSRPCVLKHNYEVLLLGCSYTYGVGVEDYETYAWHLSKRFPNVSFDN